VKMRRIYGPIWPPSVPAHEFYVKTSVEIMPQAGHG
jgi:hypothetical protein